MFCHVLNCWQTKPCAVHFQISFHEYQWLAMVSMCFESLTYDTYNSHHSQSSRKPIDYSLKRPKSIEWECYVDGQIIRKHSNPEHCAACPQDPHHYHQYRNLYWCFICLDHKDVKHVHENQTFPLPNISARCFHKSCLISLSSANHIQCVKCGYNHHEGLHHCKTCQLCFEEPVHCADCEEDPHHLKPSTHSKRVFCGDCNTCHARALTYCTKCAKCFEVKQHCTGDYCTLNPHHWEKYPTCPHCPNDPHHQKKWNFKHCGYCALCHSCDKYYHCEDCKTCFDFYVKHCLVCTNDPHHIEMARTQGREVAEKSKQCDKCGTCHPLDYERVGSVMNAYGSYCAKFECVTAHCDTCKQCYNKTSPHYPCQSTFTPWKHQPLRDFHKELRRLLKCSDEF